MRVEAFGESDETKGKDYITNKSRHMRNANPASDSMMGRRQMVRQRPLEPPSAGSSPAAPTNFRRSINLVHFPRTSCR
jgi:hypothetical protein